MKTTALAAVALAFCANAADCNLLNNPGFEKDATGFPADWCFNREYAAKTYDVSEDGVVSLRAPKDGSSFNQVDIHLVPGRKYVLGAEVRTSGIPKEFARLVVYNYAWTESASLYLPTDTGGEWQKVSLEFEAMRTRDELYSFTFYFKGGGEGVAAIRAPFVRPASGVVDGEERAPRFSFGGDGSRRQATPERLACGKKLNSLVRRLLAADAKPGVANRFSTACEGWIWIALSGGADGAKEFKLDGKAVGAAAVGGRMEAMCRVPAGEHVLVADSAGELVVNSIPTIMGTYFPDPIDAPFYAKEFALKHILPAFNTFSYGWNLAKIAKSDRAELDRLGREIFGQTCRWNPRSSGFNGRMEPSDHLAKRMLATPGMNDPRMSGLTFDEIAAVDLLEKQRFTGALRLLADAERPIWVWSSGVKYDCNEINADYLSSIASACRGSGRLMLECYARTAADEKSAAEYLQGLLDDNILRTEKMVPGFRRAAMIVNGAYTELGGYCTDCRPAADVKRFWDMYLNKLATSPVAEGLAGVGLYAIHRSEEEDLRWACRLFRHYAIEGRTDMLSDEYGFAYNPGHIRNPDFAEGLSGWTAVPAEEGGVGAAELKKLAASQGRRDLKAGGNKACRFRRSAKRPNVLSQKIVGLVPGRVYSVRVAVSDAKEVASGKWNPRKLAFGVEVRGAEDVTAKSAISRWGEPVRVARTLNEITVVFKALAKDAELVFSDWESSGNPGGPVGEELVFNAVRVKPYYVD
ncbi:MAG: carbohydrate binding domain-containing protein [Kiritimatiellae bacterium]|nr:carbohydrate binding domain-containing protein [Kiritimatiellia bacterium]